MSAPLDQRIDDAIAEVRRHATLFDDDELGFVSRVIDRLAPLRSEELRRLERLRDRALHAEDAWF